MGKGRAIPRSVVIVYPPRRQWFCNSTDLWRTMSCASGDCHLCNMLTRRAILSYCCRLDQMGRCNVSASIMMTLYHAAWETKFQHWPQTYSHTYNHIRSHTSTHTHTLHAHARTHTHTNTHTQTHTHTHTHTHTQKYIRTHSPINALTQNHKNLKRTHASVYKSRRNTSLLCCKR